MKPDHHPYYCEENIHRLVGSGVLPADAWVVIITNPQRSVACWSQKAAPNPGDAVVWDYHVVAVEPAAVQVWDLDSVLAPPCSLKTWLTATFRPGVPEQLKPLLRPVPASEFLADLRSDRSHMRSEDGGWTYPPPSWPAPGAAEGGGSNLEQWLDPAAGDWLSPAGLLQRCYESLPK